MPSLFARMTFVALLGLCIASPAVAQRAARTSAKTTAAKTTTAKATTRAKLRAPTSKAAKARPAAKQVKTSLVKTRGRAGRAGVVRVSDKASVKKADAAVIRHLASGLSLRGPKAERLQGARAQAAIKQEWAISDTRIIANADPAVHPITGNATVVVSAARAAQGKLGKAFNMKRKREFIVNIGTDGKATVVGERSGSKVAKFMRAINEKLAVSQVVRDVLASSGVRKAGASIGVLALAVLAGQTGISDFAAQMTDQLHMLGPVVLTAATISAKNGMGRRTTARLQVFEQLTQTLDRELNAGKSITIEAAYSRYQAALKEVKIGNRVTRNIKAPSREDFVNALAAWETARNTAPLAQ